MNSVILAFTMLLCAALTLAKMRYAAINTIKIYRQVLIFPTTDDTPDRVMTTPWFTTYAAAEAELDNLSDDFIAKLDDEFGSVDFHDITEFVETAELATN